METYSIEITDLGYSVRVIGPFGGEGYLVGGFPSWGKAQEWIGQRLIEASTSGQETPNAS